MHRRGRVGLLALVVLGIVLSAAPTLARVQPSAPAQSATASTAADSAIGTAQAQSGQRSITERLMENGRVINMIDDLLGFWAQARNQPLARQRWFWRRTVERKYADYFERAVYRGADEATRRAILDDYLTRAPERLEALAHFNQLITDPGVSPLVQELIDFRVWFRDFRPKTDIYIGPSLFRFDGAIRPLGNKDGVPDTLCLGAEVLADYEPDQLRMTLAHELFHLYHFGFLFDHASPEDFKTAHIPLMIEGMAVAATELLYPTLDRRIHLHFDDEELAAQEKQLGANAARFLQLMTSSAPPEQFEGWFNSSDPDVPARGGYFLGQEIVRRLLTVYTLDQLVRMKPYELKARAEHQMHQIAQVHVL
ncbi:MAG TPA: hypothetical protein VKM94_06850 [Blastocatellia bacterium]|nr:hypothetical protein [Blastocatellia bacterium]